MKKYISYTMIALLAMLAISTAASNEDMMQEKEKAAWQTFKHMKSLAITDYKVTSDGPDTCVMTYKVAIEGTYDGKDQTGTYNAASVWKKVSGQWQAIFHTNVKQAPAGG